MNIAALKNSNNVGASAIAVQNSQTSVTSSRGSMRGGAATVSVISPAADMLAKLSALKSSDPEQFQATMKKMADGLRTEAKAHTGDSAKFLNGLADRVTEAAQTGDLSVLNPPNRDADASSGKAGAGPRPGGPPPGGGAPPSGAGRNTSSKRVASTDPADTNGDGTVSAAEKAIYALTHPSASQAVASGSSSSSGI